MERSRRQPLVLISIVIIVISGIVFASTLLKKKSFEKGEYSASIRMEKKRQTALVGSRASVSLWLQNIGRMTWSSKTVNPCLLSYHLLDESGKVIQYDNQRFPLPFDVLPDQKVDMKIEVRTPLDGGEYILEFDLLREGISWFKDYGSKTGRARLKTISRNWPEADIPLSLEKGAFTKFESSVPEFDTLGKLIRLTLENNRLVFEGRSGRVSCFTPGAEYSQVWLRDANTILPVSVLYYETPYLISWLEEHLFYQNEDGSLQDWIDAGGGAGRNTTETDQESSAVQAAHRIFSILGPDWLKKMIGEQEIIHRLERALRFVLENRFDRSHGLITGAHTADWGDVDMVDPDEQAVVIDNRTRWTLDIYDQSMFYAASLRLSEMLLAAGEEQRASSWKIQAESIRQNADKRLWNEEEGFYKIHLHLENWEHGFDEDNMLAMGGNAMAILSGMAGRQKAASIIGNALERQKTFQVSTISGTLLPPYPENVFLHPLLDSPFEYQNGGQWDWFGGRLVLAMFREGFSNRAREKLIEIAAKNGINRCLYEWDDRMGTGRGSEDYSGSAGSLGQALFEGYFGILWTGDGFDLQPRLGRDSGRIHVYIPAADAFVAYEYAYFPQDERIELSFNSSTDKIGEVRMLLPWEELEGQTENGKAQSLLVRLDGNDSPFSILIINSDTYIALGTDFKRHTLSVRFVQ